jgi:hypothetical protein
MAVALVVTLAACGGDDDEPNAAATTPAATTVTTSEAPATTPPATTPPATTTPVTTATPTSAPATSAPATTGAPATAWIDSTFVPGASLQGYSGNWEGDAGPSPAAPADGERPADGYYVATVIEPWSPADDHLSVRIQRLESCDDLPDGCEYTDDGVDAMNIDPSWQLDMDVPLDPTTDVVVQGFRCWDAPEQKQGTGNELAALFDAYTTDYQSVIAPKLSEAANSYDVALAVAADPAGGFVGEESVCPGGMAGPLRYVHADAPVLLLQTVTDPDGGSLDATELIQLDGVQFTNGVPLFYFYAGFYS